MCTGLRQRQCIIVDVSKCSDMIINRTERTPSNRAKNERNKTRNKTTNE